MVWDFSEENPELKVDVPPEATDEVSSWVLAGNSADGLSWQPCAGGTITVSGSLANLIEVAPQDDGTNALQLIPEYTGEVDQFSFLILDELGCIDYFTFEEDWATAGVMCWDYDSMQPYLEVPPEAADDYYFLEGTEEFGIGWTSLTEATADIVLNTFTSENNSIIIEQNLHGDVGVNLEINPAYFTSEDGTVIITETEVGLDFSANAMGSIESPNESIIVTPPAEDAEEKITTLEINPAYFTSIDESVDILPISDTELDFSVPDLYKIKISQEDEAPGFLPSKLVVDESAAGLIQLVPEGNVLKIKSALQGSGIMILNNGKVETLAAPGGKAVLVCDGGTFAWVEYGDCENACN